MDDKIKIVVHEDKNKGFMPLTMQYMSSESSIDSAAFYCPYIPLHVFDVPDIRNNIVTIKWNVVRIQRISDNVLNDIADNIDFISQIKHSNKNIHTILFKADTDSLVYLKLKGVI